jgi:hypothetical protein
MSLVTWLQNRTRGFAGQRRAAKGSPRRQTTFRPQLEALEGRDVPSFSSPHAYAVTLPAALIAADVNHDGNPDLITLRNQYGSSIAVQLGTGKGTFASPVYSNLAVPGLLYYSPTAFAVGDVNGDGKPDIVVAYQDTAPFPTNTPPPSPLTVLLGNGKGSFTAAGKYPVFPNDATITSLALADVDGNGTLDVVAGSSQTGAVYVAPNLGGGRFGPEQTYAVPAAAVAGGGPMQVAVGDFNGDGKPDIVAAADGYATVFLNNGNGTFGTPQAYAVGAVASVALGDFNGDGKLDIVTTGTNGTVSVLLNNGNGTFGTAQTYAIGGPANSVAVGDFNHDGHLDIVTTGAEMDVLLNNGNGTFGAYQKVGPAGSHVVVADFNRDGFPDLAQIDASGGSIDVLLNNADWTTGSTGHK